MNEEAPNWRLEVEKHFKAAETTAVRKIKDTNPISHINGLIKIMADSGLINAYDISDKFHTFSELYSFRMAYNVLLFNEWAKLGLYSVHKSYKHYDGEECFGGGWFVVIAMLPDGQITNHYKNEHWELFKIPEKEKVQFEYDGHTPQDTLYRMFALNSSQK